MSSKRDTDLLIKAFLEEGINELPDRSFDAVRTAIDQKRQSAVFGPWKESQIMNATRLVLAAAAIILIAGVLAIRFVPTSSTGGPTATATPTPTPMSLTVTGSGPVPIEAGDYAVASPFLAPLTFTVPDGWSGNIGGPYLVDLNPEGRSYINLVIFNDVYADPCHSNLGLLNPPLGPSVDDLVTALKTMPSVTVSAQSDGTFAGVAAKQLTLTASTSVAGCTLNSDGQFPIWQLPLGAINSLHPGGSEQLSILQVDGQRLVVASAYTPDDLPISGVIDSIRFTSQP